MTMFLIPLFPCYYCIQVMLTRFVVIRNLIDGTLREMKFFFNLFLFLPEVKTYGIVVGRSDHRSRRKEKKDYSVQLCSVSNGIS